MRDDNGVGDVLFRNGDWCLVRDWSIHYDVRHLKGGGWHSRITVNIVHCCFGEAWKTELDRPYLLKTNLCSSCGKPVPAELLGLQALTNWER